MPRLHTSLPIDECLRRLREQVAPGGFFARYSIFRKQVSPVRGFISGRTLTLECSADRFSQRFFGTIAAARLGCVIDYEWRRGLWQRIYGDSALNAEVILDFLHEWLGTEPYLPDQRAHDPREL